MIFMGGRNYGDEIDGLGRDWFIIQSGMQVDKRRRRFMIEIKRQRKEDYFRSRREMLLKQPPSSTLPSRLHYLLKLSLLPNGILPLLRSGNLIEQLSASSETGIPEERRYVIAICSNALLDQLQLQQKQALAGLLYRLYKEYGTSRGRDTRGVAASLLSFAKALPYLGEDMAGDGQAMVCQLAIQIINASLEQPPSQGQQDEMRETMRAVECLLAYEKEDLPQLEQHFSRNVLFYNALLQLHPLLFKRSTTPHCVAARQSILRIFQQLSRNIHFNLFPLIIEGQAFSNFLLTELLASSPYEWKHSALDIFGNLLSDYSNCDSNILMNQLAKPQSRMEAVFRTLLINDRLVYWRMRVIKLLLLGNKVEMQWLFQAYWREVADLCTDVLDRGEDVDNAHLAMSVLLIMVEKKEGDRVLLNYLRNAGTEPIMERILEKLSEARRGGSVDDEEIAGEMEAGLGYLIDQLQQWD